MNPVFSRNPDGGHEYIQVPAIYSSLTPDRGQSLPVTRCRFPMDSLHDNTTELSSTVVSHSTGIHVEPLYKS